jgi:hypothetical protein
MKVTIIYLMSLTEMMMMILKMSSSLSWLIRKLTPLISIIRRVRICIEIYC